MEVLLVILFVLGFVFFIIRKTPKSKDDTPKTNINTPGMYFMELHEEVEQKRKSSIETVDDLFYIHVSDWYLVLAYACQGRCKDVDAMYDFHKDKELCVLNDAYLMLLETEKKRIYATTRIVKRIEDGNMLDMRIGESIGEYIDRKLLKSKLFMEKYQYYIRFDFEEYYKKNIKT